MTIKPIKTEEDYKSALAEINRLFDAHEGTEDFDRLDVLVTLVEAYEAKHYPIGPPSPLAAIEYEMEKRGLSPRGLEPLIGSGKRVSEVLNGQRPLTMTMIRRLHSQFNLSADVLIARYPLKTSRLTKRTQGRAKRPPFLLPFVKIPPRHKQCCKKYQFWGWNRRVRPSWHGLCCLKKCGRAWKRHS